MVFKNQGVPPMKFACSILFLFLLNLFAFSQAPADNVAAVQGVEAVTLFKDDGKGEADAESVEFLTTDSPIHCRIELATVTRTAVKMVVTAADVKGMRSGTKAVSTAFQTNGQQNIVNFKFSNKDGWLPGKYRIDVLLDGVLGKSLDFTIAKPTKPATDKPSPKTSAKSRPVTARKRRN
jgi:hypothetical protein